MTEDSKSSEKTADEILTILTTGDNPENISPEAPVEGTETPAAPDSAPTADSEATEPVSEPAALDDGPTYDSGTYGDSVVMESQDIRFNPTE